MLIADVTCPAADTVRLGAGKAFVNNVFIDSIKPRRK